MLIDSSFPAVSLFFLPIAATGQGAVGALFGVIVVLLILAALAGGAFYVYHRGGMGNVFAGRNANANAPAQRYQQPYQWNQTPPVPPGGQQMQLYPYRQPLQPPASPPAAPLPGTPTAPYGAPPQGMGQHPQHPAYPQASHRQQGALAVSAPYQVNPQPAQPAQPVQPGTPGAPNAAPIAPPPYAPYAPYAPPAPSGQRMSPQGAQGLSPIRSAQPLSPAPGQYASPTPAPNQPYAPLPAQPAQAPYAPYPPVAYAPQPQAQPQPPTPGYTPSGEPGMGATPAPIAAQPAPLARQAAPAEPVPPDSAQQTSRQDATPGNEQPQVVTPPASEPTEPAAVQPTPPAQAAQPPTGTQAALPKDAPGNILPGEAVDETEPAGRIRFERVAPRQLDPDEELGEEPTVVSDGSDGTQTVLRSQIRTCPHGHRVVNPRLTVCPVCGSPL